MNKKANVFFVVLLLIVFVPMFLSGYSITRRSWVLGNIYYLNPDTNKACVQVYIVPEPVVICVNVVSQTKITSIVCNEDEMIKIPMDFTDLRPGMWMEAKPTMILQL